VPTGILRHSPRMFRMYRFAFNALLGLAFVLSVSLSAAEVAGMAMPMDMAGMATGNQHDCGDCTGSTDKNGMKSQACTQACLPLVAAILPAEFAVSQVESRAHFAPDNAFEWDWAPAPNPSPPRS